MTDRLAAVNFCLFIVGTVQVSRIVLYRRSHAGSVEGGLEEMGGEMKESIKGAEAGIKVEAKKVEAKL
jgi:hypothetical protein